MLPQAADVATTNFGETERSHNRSAQAVRQGVADRANMTRAIESTLAIHTVGSLWLLGCVLFQHWWS